MVETNTSGYRGNLKQLVDNKEQLVQYTSGTLNNAQKNYIAVKKEILVIVLCIQKFQTPYNAFSVIYSDNNLIFSDLILTKDVNKLFQDCKKLYLLFEANQIHYQSLFPTEIEKRNLTHEFLQRNKILEKHLKLLFALEKCLVCETTIFYFVRMKTICVQTPLTDKLLFNNSNLTHPSLYKKSSSIHSMQGFLW
ncbi:hypothetical protein CFOL_v3_19006 [Cephalotus follicularis]|uniref:Reverse transcriptase RNase H-like domain-containing protein n=1 Tax=Cephalotus follicularis TaxID=3775 RepID=A0A1Q3C5K0_CEPFO|nr:hypothetical protein CFOL_v3_19006 [Cephalotus follicularis]